MAEQGGRRRLCRGWAADAAVSPSVTRWNCSLLRLPRETRTQIIVPGIGIVHSVIIRECVAAGSIITVLAGTVFTATVFTGTVIAGTVITGCSIAVTIFTNSPLLAEHDAHLLDHRRVVLLQGLHEWPASAAQPVA